MRETILVTDGEQRSALAVVRSLGAAGYRVHVCSSRPSPLAGASRHAGSTRMVPDPLAEPAGFSRTIVELTRSTAADVVLPVTDASVLALLPARESLGSAVLPFPEGDAFIRISDKHLLLEAAMRLGIAVPRHCLLRDAGELEAVSRSGLRPPFAVKSVRSVSGSGAVRVKTAVRYAGSTAELAARVATLPAQAFPVLVQERIIGPGLGVFLLRWNGAVVAHFGHRRLREKPPAGGVSVRAESVPLDPRLLAQAEALLGEFDWQGVAMIEFKRDLASGRDVLMEVNGRFWGSLQLAIDAGVDFPRLLVELALGRDVQPVHGYRLGVRRRWWWGEVDHLLARMRRSAQELALPPGVPSRLRTAIDLVGAPFRGVRGEVWRLDDPGPGLRETVSWLLGR